MNNSCGSGVQAASSKVFRYSRGLEAVVRIRLLLTAHRLPDTVSYELIA
jgi:hypothetical protein